jgi:hypothetical protein
MSQRIPTKPGDILILQTTQSYTVYAIGRVSKDGQQDFQGATDVKYENDHTAAVAQAKALAVPDRRIFLQNIDTDEWSEIPN